MKCVFMPSILSADFATLGADIDKVNKGGANSLHIDVMDGVFVPSISFGMPVLESVRKCTDMQLDVHIMITQPERYIEEFAKLGADGITFHYEATKKHEEVIRLIKGRNLKVGMAINPETDVEVLYDYLDTVDMFLIMTVHPGFGGQKYIEESTQRIKKLRGEMKRRGVNKDIQVDGGINEETIRIVLEAGANAVVAGSAVFKGDIVGNTEKYLGIMSEYTDRV